MTETERESAYWEQEREPEGGGGRAEDGRVEAEDEVQVSEGRGRVGDEGEAHDQVEDGSESTERGLVEKEKEE